MAKKAAVKKVDPKEQQRENWHELAKMCRRYVELKAQMEEMEKEKKALAGLIKQAVPERGKAKGLGDPEIAGRIYTIKITEVQSKRMDQDLVRKFLTDEQIEVCTKLITSERMTVEATDIVAQAACEETNFL